MKHRKLPQEFFEFNADRVAYDLIGCIFNFRRGRKYWRARIVETEAYLGTEDLACHASKGLTKRTKIMFGPAGFAYVYLIYGMYQMLNIVCSKEGDPQAVLIRAAESLEPPDLNLSGPGRLTKNFGIEKSHNGLCLFGENAYFEKSEKPRKILTSPRIGIDYAAEWKDKALRFFDADSPAVSRLPSKSKR